MCTDVGVLIAGSLSGHSLQQINTRLSSSQLRRNSLAAASGLGTPNVPGTPRGVFIGSGGVLGMSVEELALDEKDSAAVKESTASGSRTTKTKRTWWGGKKTMSEVSSSVADTYADVEAGPEPRRPMLLAPIYNGLAAGLSVCECISSAFLKVCLGGLTN